jgi:hypothetical protein
VCGKRSDASIGEQTKKLIHSFQSNHRLASAFLLAACCFLLPAGCLLLPACCPSLSFCPGSHYRSSCLYLFSCVVPACPVDRTSYCDAFASSCHLDTWSMVDNALSHIHSGSALCSLSRRRLPKRHCKKMECLCTYCVCVPLHIACNCSRAPRTGRMLYC